MALLHSFLLVILPAMIICKAIPADETAAANVRDTRAFDSLMGGGLGRDLSHTIRKLPMSQRSRMDSLAGFGLGRSFDNEYVLYPYYPSAPRTFEPVAGEMSKRGFDQIDSAGFGQFSKRAFDQIDSAGFGSFSKRAFDQIDSAGFGSFSKRNFDQLDRPGMNGFGNFMGKRDMGKRNFDVIDRSGFGAFSRRR